MTDHERPAKRASKSQGSRSIGNVLRPRRQLREGKSNVRRFAIALRKDRLYRTSVLLVTDNLLLGALGGLFVLIATHVWEPRSIGVVSAIGGATGLLVIAASLGLPSTIVAYLASEPDQALMVRGALFLSVPVGMGLLATVWLLPGHAGVPITELGVSIPWAVTLTMALVTVGPIVIVIDPALLARQEVSWTVGKDLTSISVRRDVNVVVTRGRRLLEVVEYELVAHVLFERVTKPPTRVFVTHRAPVGVTGADRQVGQVRGPRGVERTLIKLTLHQVFEVSGVRVRGRGDLEESWVDARDPEGPHARSDRVVRDRTAALA